MAYPWNLAEIHSTMGHLISMQPELPIITGYYLTQPTLELGAYSSISLSNDQAQEGAEGTSKLHEEVSQMPMAFSLDKLPSLS